MTFLFRPPEDPMGLTEAVEVETGVVYLDVVMQRHHSWYTTVSSHFRGWRGPKPNISYEREYYVREPGDHPNAPLTRISCIARHAGKNLPNTAINHLEALLDSMVELAHTQGIPIYAADSPKLTPYWNTKFDIDILGDIHQRYAAGKPAFHPGESILEPVAVAIQHELLNSDLPFQLTADPNAPPLELVYIAADHLQWWDSVPQALSYALQAEQPPMELQIGVSTNQGQDVHRLFPKCLPLDDAWHSLSTHDCSPHHAASMLAKANTTHKGFKEYPEDTPQSEYVEDNYSTAEHQAYNAVHPNHGELAKFFTNSLRQAQRAYIEPPTHPVTVSDDVAGISLIAYPEGQPHTAVPTELLDQLSSVLASPDRNRLVEAAKRITEPQPHHNQRDDKQA